MADHIYILGGLGLTPKETEEVFRNMSGDGIKVLGIGDSASRKLSLADVEKALATFEGAITVAGEVPQDVLAYVATRKNKKEEEAPAVVREPTIRPGTYDFN